MSTREINRMEKMIGFVQPEYNYLGESMKAFEQLQSMKSVTAQLRQVHESLYAHLPVQKTQSLPTFTNHTLETKPPSLSYLTKMAESVVQSPIPKMADIVGSVGGFARSELSALKSLSRAMQHFQVPEIGGLHESLIFQQAQSRTFREITKQVSATLHSVASFTSYRAILENLVESFKLPSQYLEKYREADITFEREEVRVDGEVVTRADLNLAIEGVKKDLKLYFDAKLDKGFESILERIEKTKETPIKIIIYRIILPLILSIASHYIIKHIQAPSHKPKAENVRKVKQELSELNIAIGDAELRFVKSSRLTIYKDRKRKSNVIGKIYFGQVVVVLERRKNWTLIEWRDDENTLYVRGWVFSRYLVSIGFKTK